MNMNNFLNNRPHIVFLSQSGQEVYNIMSFFKRKPDAIITNRQDDIGLFIPLLQEKDEGKLNWITLPKNPEPIDYKKVLKKFKNPVITLHGYLRILPKAICAKYEIYNLHPGLITEYPELKGKDPQKRAIEASHPRVGCVIHRVIPEVDEGEIIMSNAINTLTVDKDRLYLNLRSMATVMWYDFFQNFSKYEQQ
jgi:folate-dependent phosphoribosylglycinamide formyltransferase PurN